MSRRLPRLPSGLLLIFVLALVSGGCSLKRIALTSVANTLAASGTTFSSDEDPDLIRDAVPFSLKTMESILAELPRHSGLLLATCSGFTQYSYAFVQADAERLEPVDFERASAERERARKLYLRARDYCLRHLDLKHPAILARLQREPVAAVAAMRHDEVPALYWTGASWGAAISIGVDKPELVADLPAVRALMERALALDPTWEKGAIHAAMISIDSLPETMGGSPARAREHFDKAVALSGGQSAGVYVSLAASLSVAAQDRAEFERLLQQALAIDPDKDPPTRLANVVAQRRARFLLSQADALFVGDADEEAQPAPEAAPPQARGTPVVLLPFSGAQ